MLNPTVLSFVQKTNEDPKLREQVANMNALSLISVADRLGYHFSLDELVSTFKSIASDEISEEDLEHVAGGYQTGGSAHGLPSLSAFNTTLIIVV
jgi:predicted ribosomally synthesized peptide with nif11-like leader